MGTRGLVHLSTSTSSVSYLRIIFVDDDPSTNGIYFKSITSISFYQIRRISLTCRSISMTSTVCGLDAKWSWHCWPSRASSTSWPNFCSLRVRTRALTGLSSAMRTQRRGPGISASTSGNGKLDDEGSVLDRLVIESLCSSIEEEFKGDCKSAESRVFPSSSMVGPRCRDCLRSVDCTGLFMEATSLSTSDADGLVCASVGVAGACSKGNSMPKMVPFPNSLCTLICPFMFLT